MLRLNNRLLQQGLCIEGAHPGSPESSVRDTAPSHEQDSQREFNHSGQLRMSDAPGEVAERHRKKVLFDTVTSVCP